MPEKFRVNALGLNLRSTPRSSSRSNIVAVLNQGDIVEEIQSDDSTEKWIKIKTKINDKEVEGFLFKFFLVPFQNHNEVAEVVREVSAVHMKQNWDRITRENRSGRAYPIGEADRPSMDMTSIEKRNESIHKIIDYLDVEVSERYEPGNNKTFCNIYAYDYCYLAGAYIPRVWWKAANLCQLFRKKEVKVAYGETIEELNANRLHDWLVEFGKDFGWVREFDLDVVQTAANKGKVVLITAKRKELNRSGHICMIAPEDAINKSERDENAKVTLPLQTQAGAKNRKYFTHFGNGSKWWTHSKYRDFGFWVHE